MVSVWWHPIHWMTLNCKDSPSGEEIFHPFWTLKTSMCQLSVIRNCNSERCDHVTNESYQEWFLCEEKWCTSKSNCMDTSNDLCNNLVFLIHSVPVFLDSWECFEIPEFVISKWLDHRNFLHLSIKSLVCLFLHINHSSSLIWFTGLLLWYGTLLVRINWFLLNWVNFLVFISFTYILNSLHKNRWVKSSTRYRWSEFWLPFH